MSTAAPRKLTAEEFLEFERASTEKHEFIDGEIFAMAGALFTHNVIVGNIVGELRTALRNQPCRAIPSDMKVRIPATNRYVYPDAAVVCGEPRFEDDVEDVLLNPRLVFEVLSKSTEAYDRGDKWQGYKSVASITQYVLVSTSQRLVEVFERRDDGSWNYRSFGPGERVPLSSCGCELAVDEVYLNVSFEV